MHRTGRVSDLILTRDQNGTRTYAKVYLKSVLGTPGGCLGQHFSALRGHSMGHEFDRTAVGYHSPTYSENIRNAPELSGFRLFSGSIGLERRLKRFTQS